MRSSPVRSAASSPGGPQLPPASPGNPVRGGAPKPASDNVCHIVDGGSDSAIFAGAHVRRFLDDLLDRQRAFAMRIVNGCPADGQRTGGRVDDRGQGYLARNRCRGNRERLHRRSGFERVVSARLRILSFAGRVRLFGIKRGPVGQSDDLTGLGIENDDGAGLRPAWRRWPPSIRETPDIAACCRLRARDRALPAAREC